MKRVVLAVMILAVLFSAAVFYFSKKAPDFLRQSIERSINKPVKIESIQYHFPWTFELGNFQVFETQEPFAKELCFSVGKVRLDVSPLSLSQKELVLDNVEVEQASVVVRHRQGKMYHVFSNAMIQAPEKAIVAAENQGNSKNPSNLPLTIRHFHFGASRFEFIDYDIQDSGFVIELDKIEADLKDIFFPFSDDKTFYRVDALMPQGRQKKPAAFKLNGWTRFKDYETDAMLSASEVFLPYFKPYYSQVTAADMEEGLLTCRSAITIRDSLLTSHLDLELSALYFKSYEDQDQLFGLKANEIISFLKDSAGKLKFQITLQWNLSEQGLAKREKIRRAIEKSLKTTVLRNVGNALENTLKKFSEGGLDQGKDDFEDTLNKVKSLFR